MWLLYDATVVPALGDARRERPPAVYGHVINVPIHLNVPIRPSDERPTGLYGHFCLVPRVSVHDRYYCSMREVSTQPQLNVLPHAYLMLMCWYVVVV